MRRAGLATLLAGALLAAPALAAGLKAPASARVGQRVSVQASGLPAQARYRLSLVGSSRAGTTCLAAVGPGRVVSRQATFRGRIPRRLRCYGRHDRLVRRARVRRGFYKLLLCRPRGAAGCDARLPAARRGIRIRSPH